MKQATVPLPHEYSCAPSFSLFHSFCCFSFRGAAVAKRRAKARFSMCLLLWESALPNWTKSWGRPPPTTPTTPTQARTRAKRAKRGGATVSYSIPCSPALSFPRAFNLRCVPQGACNSAMKREKPAHEYSCAGFFRCVVRFTCTSAAIGSGYRPWRAKPHRSSGWWHPLYAIGRICRKARRRSCRRRRPTG